MIKFTFPEFPTHVQISKERRAKKDKDGKILNPKVAGKPKFEKITGQSIYNRTYHVMVQDKIIKYLKDYLKQGLSKADPIYLFPISIELEIHTIKHHGGISMYNGNIRISKSDKWDIGNLGYIWSKCFDDCLTELNLIPDDSIKYVKSTGKVTFIEVEKFEDRKLVFIIN